MSFPLAAGEAIKATLLLSAHAGSLQIGIPVEGHVPWQTSQFNGARHQFVIRCNDVTRAVVWLNQLRATRLPIRTPDVIVSSISIAWCEQAAGVLFACIEALSGKPA